MSTLKPQYLQLQPSAADEKRWVAEITGDDPTFILSREFQPEIEPGVWAMYDGWYQIHGQTPGITPFQKEYVRVLDGKMTRRLDFRFVKEHVPQIKAAEPERKERLKHQIISVFNEIKAEVPHELVDEAIMQQQEDLDMVETSQELLGGLKVLLKQKDRIIKSYKEAVENFREEW
ncbi:hypothetical protein [Ruoffia sp. FAM 20857]|uniref:hypothetical protein n=1 Tax=Ruoffia sp. FAM 20857 TaxID=3259515 RepID=UPI00388AFD43